MRGTSGAVRVTIVSPHLDDAVLSAGMTIRVLVSSGYLVRVVTVFTRAAEQHTPAALLFNLAGARNVRDGLARRRAEDLRALTRLGAARAHLGLCDASFRWHRRSSRLNTLGPDAFVTPPLPPEPETERAIGEALEAHLARTRPDVVLLPGAVGGHVDHVLVRAAAEEVLRRHPDLTSLAYEDLPYAATPTGADGNANAFNLRVVGTEADLDAKLEAVGCYGSQLAQLAPGGDWRGLLTRHARERGRGAPAEALSGTGPLPW